jgi:hypothetical protein
MAKDTIYTRDVAANIVEIFEDVLCEHEISIPSPEDDERDEDDKIGLYGSTYYDILDSVEARIKDLVECIRYNDVDIIENAFGNM